MGQNTSTLKQDMQITLSTDSRSVPTADILYLELPLKNGTTIFIPVGETCVPID